MLYKILNSVFCKNRAYREHDIDYDTAIEMLNNKNGVLLDVRSPQEYKEGHLNNSINLPVYDISKRCLNMFPVKDSLIIVYCQSGSRSKRAIEILLKKGYKNVYNIVGGLDNI